MSAFMDLSKIWKSLVLFCVPAIASPILTIDGSKEMACLYGIIIMAIYWITEALPLAVTALLPVVLFPVLGVLPAKEVASSYVKDATVFSFCCLTFALSVERWQLHKRIALTTILQMGSSPKWLMLGFMLPTWFLSMWVNNTSSTAMMMPVVMAVLNQLREIEVSERNRGGPNNEDIQTTRVTETRHTDVPLIPKEADAAEAEQEEERPRSCEAHEFIYPHDDFKHLCKALSLCVCYAASIGGTASITGSSTNLVMQGQADAVFGKYGLESGVNFLNWIVCCLPTSVLCIITAWVWLVLKFFGVRELLKCEWGTKETTRATREVIMGHLQNLGPLSFAEKAVMGHFMVLVVLWLSMKIPGGVGWSYIFEPGFVNNSTSGILVVISLFIFPSERPCVSECLGNADVEVKEGLRSVPSLLDWKTVHQQFPWGTWCLLGGGYALANACQESGLSFWIGNHLSAFSSMEPWVMVLVLSVVISFMTEITSNAATASIISPILAQLAISLEMNPLYLLFPMALTCSMAFILPVATPPNAIVFAAGHVKVKDMVKAGVVLNMLCVLIINAAVNTWMNSFMQLDVLPYEMSRKLSLLQPTQDIHEYINTSAPILSYVNGSFIGM